MLINIDNDQLSKIATIRRQMHKAVQERDFDKAVELHKDATDLSFAVISIEIDRLDEANKR